MTREIGRPHIDLLFDALSDHRRRQILTYMHTSEEDSFNFDELAQIIANENNETSDVSQKQRKRVKLTLHHRHLPKLDDAGLIEYDPRNGDIRYRGTADSEIIDIPELLNPTSEPAGSLNQLK